MEENLLLPPRVRPGGLSVAQIYEIFPNLKERLASQGTKLSGGEQQMLAIGRILRTGARLLLLDEPTEGLAPVIVQQIGRTIARLKQRRLHHPAGGAEFPVRRTARRPALRDGARARRGHDSQRRAGGEHGKAARLSRRLEPPFSTQQPGGGDHVTETKLESCGGRSRCSRAAAHAQISDGVVKIGVLTDMSSLYADLAGPGSVVAAQMAVEDSGASKKGIKVEIVSADHQNKPDVGSNIARQWYDVDKVDVIVDVPNSGVALAVNQITREKGKAFLVSGAASVRPDRARPARPTPCTGPTTPGCSPTAPATRS